MEKAAGQSRGLMLVLAAIFILALSSNALCDDTVQERMKFLTEVKEPVSIQAESVEYDRKTGTFTAAGKVTISQGKAVLTADRAVLDEATGDAEAIGNARLVTDENVLFAERIKVNFNTKLGVIQEGNIFVQRGNYHIKGYSLKRVTANEYVITKGSITTCDAPNPFWKVTAGRLDVRMDKDVTARNVVMRIKGIPVLYTPYAWFPLLKPRTTGFLLPGTGYSTREGFRLIDSFYWAPVDNFDATLTGDYRSHRGLGVGTELRFALDKDTRTNLYVYFLDDRKDKKFRYNLALKHQQVLSETISGRADVNLSDRQYYRELTESTRTRTQRSIDSNVFVTDRWDWGRAYFFNQYTLGLDLNNDVIVQRLPDLGINVVKKPLFDMPLYLDLDSSMAYFYKQKGVTGGRFDLYPKLTGTFNLGGVNFVPRVGYRETVYELGGAEKAGLDDERGLFGAGITTLTGLYKVFSFDSGPFAGIRHTLEPSVSYNYVLRRGGVNFPKFDGVDTLGRRNSVAYSLTNRFVLKYRDGAEEPRVDYLTLRLSQFYDFYAVSNVLGPRRDLSSLYGEVYYKAGAFLTITNNFRYNFGSGIFLSVNTDVRFDDRLGRWRFVLGQRFSRDADQTFMAPSRFDFFTPSTDFVSDFIVATQEEQSRVNFLTAETGVKITRYLDAAVKVWYDAHTKNFRETDVSTTYTSQCWGITASYVSRPGERQILFTVNLKGIGNVKI